MFYFADANAFSIGNNSGKPNKCPFQFNTKTESGSIANGAKCTSTSDLPGNIPGTLQGNILLAPCQLPTVNALCAPNCSINYGDPLGTNDPIGEQRGILFFQNRDQNAGSNPNWGGGGQFLLSGTMYFHQCTSGGTGTDQGGTGCSASAYNDVLTFSGNSGAGNYVVGEIIVDQFAMNGTPVVNFDLNKAAIYYVLKAALLR